MFTPGVAKRALRGDRQVAGSDELASLAAVAILRTRAIAGIASSWTPSMTSEHARKISPMLFDEASPSSRRSCPPRGRRVRSRRDDGDADVPARELQSRSAAGQLPQGASESVSLLGPIERQPKRSGLARSTEERSFARPRPLLEVSPPGNVGRAAGPMRFRAGGARRRLERRRSGRRRRSARAVTLLRRSDGGSARSGERCSGRRRPARAAPEGAPRGRRRERVAWACCRGSAPDRGVAATATRVRPRTP